MTLPSNSGRFSSRLLLREDNRSFGFDKLVRQTRLRIVGNQRHVASARFEDSQQPDDHLRRALHAKSDRRVRSYAILAQVVRQLVGPRVQLRVGKFLLAAAQRGPVRVARRLLLKQFVNALAARVIRFCLVERRDHLLPLLRVHDRKRRHGRIRIRRSARQQRPKTPR